MNDLITHNYIRSNKQSGNSEVHGTNDEILIPVSTNIPIVISPSYPVLLKTPTKTQIPSIDVTYIQHQIDRLRKEMERNAAKNNELRNLIKQKPYRRKKFSIEKKQKYFFKKLPFLKNKTNVLKTRLKTNKQKQKC